MKISNMSLLLIACVILIACGPSQAERDAQATQIVDNIFATRTAEAPTALPTPDMSPGQVRGALLNANQQPVKGIRLGLLRTVRSGGDDQGEVIGGMEVKSFVTLDGVFVQVVDAGVVATTDSSGVFSFEHVPPGEYVPYVMSSRDNFKDANGETLVFTLLPGQVVNLAIQKQ